MKEKLDGLQVQVNALSQIINGGATSITESRWGLGTTRD